MWTCKICDNDIDVEWIFDDICPYCKYYQLKIEIGLLRKERDEWKRKCENAWRREDDNSLDVALSISSTLMKKIGEKKSQ